MSLAAFLKSSFSSTLRASGDEYFRERRVRHISSTGHRQNFQVQGSRLYKLSIDYTPATKQLKATCSCPAFETDGLCKHIWAAFRRSDELQLFTVLEGQSDIQFQLPESKNRQDAELAPDDEELEQKNSDWKSKIESALFKSRDDFAMDLQADAALSGRATKRMTYVLLIKESQLNKKVFLKFFAQSRLKTNDWTTLRPQEISQQQLGLLEDKFDQDLMADLIGKAYAVTSSFGHTQDRALSGVLLEESFAAATLLSISKAKKLMVATAGLSSESHRLRPYEMRSENWNFELELTKIETSFFLRATVSNGFQRKPLDQVLATIPGLVFFDTFSAFSNLHEHAKWSELFDRRRAIEIPQSDVESFLDLYLKNQNAPQISLPDDIKFEEVSNVQPVVDCRLRETKDSSYYSVAFDFKYGDFSVLPNTSQIFIYDIVNRKKIRRNFEFEKTAQENFLKVQLAASPRHLPRLSGFSGYLHTSRLIELCEQFASFGWQTFIKQVQVRSGAVLKFEVTSGIDWFDLKADLKLNDMNVSLPSLLKQIKLGETFIQLSDGSQALISQQLIGQLQSLAKVGDFTETGIRLNKVQYLFMSSLLAEIPGFKSDQKFSALNALLKQLQNPPPVKPAQEFLGVLRPYQLDGLAWLTTLSDEHMGGILADDMGLGKTIQILALLSNESQGSRPNLVVAPKSLVFNWAKESEKFLPGLKTVNYVGSKRKDLLKNIQANDLIITTYQTLRADIDEFQKINFNLVVFDEAHFIKNSASQAFKACRLLQAEKRISLTGTPVENSVRDLLSLLAVTLPGLLTESQKAQWSSLEDRDKIQALSKAVSPFVLRRTKDYVLKDLPEKSEQVLYCELSSDERAKYNELKKYYWSELSGSIEKNGMAKSKIHVLEALLRLRQAACHIGLLDQKDKKVLSAKFELLLDHLTAVIDEGHKVLIFSQFTSLLELLKSHLNDRQIQFEYLDGKTKDRQAIVERFQSDPASRVFLLSLKAGGVGLNLTAANYVYILDPWWNPAAEAQAIDRTHRIGQTNKVFAYKIIAKGTIEEKILELQGSKKQLAKDLVSDDGSLIKNMQFDDLKMLFE